MYQKYLVPIYPKDLVQFIKVRGDFTKLPAASGFIIKLPILSFTTAKTKLSKFRQILWGMDNKDNFIKDPTPNMIVDEVITFLFLHILQVFF